MNGKRDKLPERSRYNHHQSWTSVKNGSIDFENRALLRVEVAMILRLVSQTHLI